MLCTRLQSNGLTREASPGTVSRCTGRVEKKGEWPGDERSMDEMVWASCHRGVSCRDASRCAGGRACGRARHHWAGHRREHVRAHRGCDGRTVRSSNWDWAGSTSTAADGSYSFYGLADGDYYLGFNGGRYGEKYYDWNYAYLTVAGTRPIIQDVGLVENAPEIAGTSPRRRSWHPDWGRARRAAIRTTVRAPTTSTPKHIATRVVATI